MTEKQFLVPNNLTDDEIKLYAIELMDWPASNDFKADVTDILKRIMTNVSSRVQYKFLIYRERKNSKNLTCKIIDSDDPDSFNQLCETKALSAQINHHTLEATLKNGTKAYYEHYGVFLFNKATQVQGALMYVLKDNGEQVLVNDTEDVVKEMKRMKNG